MQKISLNADLGFILSLVDFFAALDDNDLLREVRDWWEQAEFYIGSVAHIFSVFPLL